MNEKKEENKILGLVNQGQNMCFINVILQALWNLLSVKKFIFDLKMHNHQIESEENFNVIMKFRDSIRESYSCKEEQIENHKVKESMLIREENKDTNSFGKTH